jgi:hypothetical protein
MGRKDKYKGTTIAFDHRRQKTFDTASCGNAAFVRMPSKE